MLLHVNGGQQEAYPTSPACVVSPASRMLTYRSRRYSASVICMWKEEWECGGWCVVYGLERA